jgi:acetyl-CoA carboxylase biotin carboxyl carrier protein
MKLDIIAQLVQILKDAPELGAIEVRRGLFGFWSSVRVSKAGHGIGGGHHVVVSAPSGGGGVGMASSAPSHTAAGAAPPPAAPASPLVEIKSPMVGTFYKSPEPGAEAYVKVGSRVSPGQVVCIIEAMKIMNEIESEVSGVVKEVLADNAQPVEFGQPLFRVDPHG